MNEEKAFEINQQSFEEKGEITEELEGLQKDIVDLNQVLALIKRCSVKEVILSEINFISAKIGSLKDLTVVNISSVMSWSNVVAGRKKNIIYAAEQTLSDTRDYQPL